MKQEPPFTVKLELCEGCNLRCEFCGIHGIRTKERLYRYMTVELAAEIGRQLRALGWTSRLEFAMHGEPTQNPNAVEILKTLHAALPNAYMLMTTNGSGFLAPSPAEVLYKIARYYMEAGLSTIALDEYDGVPWAAALRKNTSPGRFKEMNIDFYEYPAQCEGNPHKRSPKKRFVIIAPINKTSKGTHSHLNNHCGAAGPLDLRTMGRICANPFRELAVRWDGTVAICCNDWRGVYKIGDVRSVAIGALWQSRAFNAARRKLLRGERDFIPCLGCTERSTRVGLLPDPMGQRDLPRATKDDLQIIKECTAGNSYTPALLRPWEKEGRIIPGKKRLL